MNRAEKRRKEREEDKKNKTIKNLDAAQRDLVNQMGQDLANRYIEKILNTLDRNLSAAVILSGGNFKDAEKFTLLTSELMMEDTFKVDRFENEFKDEEECQMAVNKISEQVEKEVENILGEGITKKEAIERLVFKFPKLSKSMLTNAYQKVKESLKEEDSAVEEAVKYIFEGEKEVNKKDEKVKPVVADKLEKKNQKEVIKVDANPAVVTSEANLNPSKLRIKSMVVEGENGTYKVCENAVELQRDNSLMVFENVEQLDNFTEEYRQVFSMIK